MKRYSNLIITVSLFALALFCLFFFEFRQTKILSDPVANELLCNVISRLSICCLFVWVLYIKGNLMFFSVRRGVWRQIIWAIPCFLVAIVNIPWSALISGAVAIIKPELIALYIIYVTAIALLEEFVFRGVVINIVYSYFRYKQYRYVWTTLVASIFFSLTHLTNLLTGAWVGSVLLQIVYSFLIGAMLSVVIFKTRNIWLCVIIHAVFNFGGLLTAYIARGEPWDLVFWILTAVCGILCAAHVVFTLYKLEKQNVS